MRAAQPEPIQSPGPDEGLYRDLIFLFLIGALFRLVLLLLLPVPYGNDGFGRLYFRDHLFLSHWLPLTQSIVLLISRFEEGIFWTRFAFALLAAASACGFYFYLRTLVGRKAALGGALLFSFNALYTILSLMPYQDVLFLGLFYAGLGFLFRNPADEGSTASSFFLGLACLTRYEAWFTLPFLFLWRVSQGFSDWRPSLWKIATSGGSFSLGPATWLVLSRLRWGDWNAFLFQTPDGNFYGWHPHFDLVWVLGYAARMVYWVLLFSSPLILLVLPGLRRLLRLPGSFDNSLRVLLGGGSLVMLFFFFIIGREQETVFRFVGFPLSICLVVATLGLDETLEWITRTFGLRRSSLAGLGVLLLVSLSIYSTIPVYRLNQDPQYRDPYQIRRYLENTLAPGERVLVVADRFHDFSDAAPMDYQRIVAQSRLPRSRILSAGMLVESETERLRGYLQANRVRYLVIFRNFEPWQEADIYFAEMVRNSPESFIPVLELETARVFRFEQASGSTRPGGRPYSVRRPRKS